MNFVPLGSRLRPPPFEPLPRAPFVVTPAPVHTRRDLALVLPESLENLRDSERSLMVADLETKFGGSGAPPRPPGRVRFAIGPDPSSFRSFYLSFRYMDFSAPETVQNCWGLMVSRNDMYDFARAATDYGLSPRDAVDAAESLLVNLLEPRFLVDRAVQTLEHLAMVGNRPRDFWCNFAQVSGNDLETAICVAHARRKARGPARAFHRALLKGMNTGMCAVNFRDGTINGEHHSVAESINLTNYLRGSYQLDEIPGLHRLLGLREDTGTGADMTLEIARGNRVPVPVRYVP